MQTFLPYEDFNQSAAVLDRQRLGKQRVENLQIARAILTPPDDIHGWANHPAVKMWVGYERALLQYQAAICFEWSNVREYNDTCMVKTIKLMREADVYHLADSPNAPRPPWLGDERFHASHRSNLLRKDPDHYRQYWPNEPDDLLYVWPTKEEATS